MTYLRPPVKLKNHIYFVLDESSSMQGHRSSLVKVFREQIAFLAKLSKDMDQETRVSVWVFSNSYDISCIVSDVDVLRLPDIEAYYHPHGMTALRDATMTALNDTKLIPQHRGDHAILVYVLSDGDENVSRTVTTEQLRARLTSLPANVTVAALVPDANCAERAEKMGFTDGNIAVWDATDREGTRKVGKKLQEATTAFYTSRSTGTRSTNQLFKMGADAVNAQTIAAAGLLPLAYSTYTIHHIPTIPEKTQIRDYINDPVNGVGRRFVLGRNFYELTKREEIQANKDIAVLEIATDRVYVGRDARKLVGLPDTKIRVSPEHNKDYRIFVRSDSVNRHLVPHTKLLILH